MNQNSDLSIRQATEADIPALLGLIRELSEYEKLSHLVVATEESYRQALFGARPVAEALMAFYEGEPVGYAIYFPSFSTFLGRAGLYLEDIYVRPQTRGKGIGKKLFAAVARIARDRDCGRFEWCVLKWNTPAIEFYQALGAESLDGWLMMRLEGDSLARVADTQIGKDIAAG
jgi:GNAT superfamily N-acetyltransferase